MKHYTISTRHSSHGQPAPLGETAGDWMTGTFSASVDETGGAKYVKCGPFGCAVYHVADDVEAIKLLLARHSTELESVLPD